jgi:catechol 2,3-dioxygenase-like lactoylglutathione lyase family enzyme
MPAPVFTALPFFVYPVREMARARAFYTGILGLRETANWDDRWVEFDIGNATLALSAVMQDAQPGAKAGAAALETPDYDAAVAWLKQQGVKFIFEPTDTGVCRFARFEDPDGNHLVLHRRHDAPAS